MKSAAARMHPRLFPFGKYKGRSISWALDASLRYCTWCFTLPAIAQRHPEFVTELRRAVAAAQLRWADQEDRCRARVAANTPPMRAHPSVADLL